MRHWIDSRFGLKLTGVAAVGALTLALGCGPKDSEETGAADAGDTGGTGSDAGTTGMSSEGESGGMDASTSGADDASTSGADDASTSGMDGNDGPGAGDEICAQLADLLEMCGALPPGEAAAIQAECEEAANDGSACGAAIFAIYECYAGLTCASLDDYYVCEAEEIAADEACGGYDEGYYDEGYYDEGYGDYTDTGFDTGLDTGLDGGLDTGLDTGMDGGMDGGGNPTGGPMTGGAPMDTGGPP